MVDRIMATSAQEMPVFFDSGDEILFGVLTQPTGNPRGVAVILIYGGGHNVSAHVGELWTRTARRVAADGFHVFRYDHHGNGDSTGRTGTFDHRYPYADDLAAAVVWLRSQGLEHFVLVGDCLGARAALAAGRDMEGLDALFLMSPMVHDARMGKDEEWAQQYGLGHYMQRAFQWRTIRRLADPEMRKAYVRVGVTKVRKVVGVSGRDRRPSAGGGQGVSGGFLDPLRDVLGHGVTTNFVFGADDFERRGEFEDAKTGSLGPILEEAGELVETSEVAGSITAHMSLKSQDELIDLLDTWLVELDGSGRFDSSSETTHPAITHGPDREQ